MSGYYNMNDNNSNDNRKKNNECSNKDGLSSEDICDNKELYVDEELNIRECIKEDRILDSERQLDLYNADTYNNEHKLNNSKNKVLALMICMMAVIIGILYTAIFKTLGKSATEDVVGVVKEDPLVSDKEIVSEGDLEEIQFNEDNTDILEEDIIEEEAVVEDSEVIQEEIVGEQSQENIPIQNDSIEETFKPTPTKDVPMKKNDTKEKIRELSLIDSRVVNIYNNFSRYPLNLMNDIIRNNEMIDYAVGYLDGINQTYDENIDISNSINYGEYKIPLLIQWDKRWGYYKYGKSTVGISGCGPTALNMVYLALKGDITMNPLKMAKFSTEKGYCVPGVGTSWSLMTDGANKLGLQSSRLSNKESLMIQNLQQGKLIIGSMGPGTFTDKGHFIVFSGYENGKFRINDPFSVEHSRKKWDYNEFGSQVKALWVFSQ